MAINKNFVIKNGVQVSTDLIIGDADNNKVGIGTTIPGYDLHVAIGRKSRGGIGATDLVVTGVSTVKDVLVTGFSGFSSDVSVTGIVSARSFGIGTTEIIDRGMRLSGIASLDAITINTIEQAIRVGPNSFTDLKVTGISTFIGIATFSTGIDIKSGVSTFSAPLRLGFAHTTDHAGVALGATVGFGTSAFFRDDAAIFMGSDSDLKIHHDGSNSRIQDVGTGDLIIQGSADIKLQSASAENYIVANDTGSVDVYFDNSKKLETTSGGLKVTGITTLTDRLHVEAGISTFDADVRFGIGATVGFGTSAFFRDDAAIFMGNDSDLKIHHDGSNSRIQDVGTGDLILQGSADIKLQSASAENYIVANDTGSVEIYYDNSKKLESTSGGLNVTGITTFSDRLHVQSGISTFDDNAKLTFGTQGDLEIYHDSSNSYIRDQSGTGAIRIQTNHLDIINAANDEQLAKFLEDGAVELYFDNSKKIETTSGGLNVTGITTFSNRINVVSGVSTFQDNAKLTFGAQADLEVFSDGSTSFLRSNDLRLRSLSGENYITNTANGAVVLFYDNGNVLQTTPQGINVSGVTTSNRLNISGVSTFTSIGSNLIPDTDGSRNIGAAGSEWQDLHIDGTANIDTLDVDATSNFADDVTLVAAGSSTILFDASAHQIVFQDNIRAKFGTGSDLSVYHDGSHTYIENNTGTLYLRAKEGENSVTAFPDGEVKLAYDDNTKLETTSGGIKITGITTISDRLQVTSGISTFYDTTQSTSATTGAVVLDGGLGVAKNVNIGGNLTVTGTTTFNGGTITLGDADTDNVVFSADVDSNIIPDDDDSFDLGSSTKEWQDLFLDGTAHIDVLDVDETAFVTTKLTVGTGVTIQNNGGVSIAGITTIGGNLILTDTVPKIVFTDNNNNPDYDLRNQDGAFVINDVTNSANRLVVQSDGHIDIAGNLDALGGVDVTGDLTVTGNVDLGDATSDTITATGRFDSNIVPSGDTQDLGTSSQEWRDLFLDGTAHVDTLDVDESATVTTSLTVGTGVTIQGNGGVSIAGITTIGGNVSIDGTVGSTGNITITNTAPAINLVDSNANDDFVVKVNNGNFLIQDQTDDVDRLTINSDGDVKIGTGVTFQGNGGVSISGLTTANGGIQITGGNITLGDSSDGSSDDAILLGAGTDLAIYSDGSTSFIKADDLRFRSKTGSENYINCTLNGSVVLYHDTLARVTTTTDGTDFGGTGSIRVPNGTTGERNSSPAAGDFRYNTTTGKFEGYTDEWGDIGGSGGVEETSTSVSSTSATSTGSFAKASFRSASIVAQITQGSAYQVGRYLLIHDGTTVTTIEESAVATGSMLGTFEGVINGSNVEFRVTMGSSSSATVKTKIDTVTV